MVVSSESAMVFLLLLGLPPKKWFWKIVQLTMKHDPFDAMEDSI